MVTELSTQTYIPILVDVHTVVNRLHAVAKGFVFGNHRWLSAVVAIYANDRHQPNTAPQPVELEETNPHATAEDGTDAHDFASSGAPLACMAVVRRRVAVGTRLFLDTTSLPSSVLDIRL